MNTTDEKRIRTALRKQIERDGSDIDAFEEALAEQVREQSETSGGAIGQDCLCVRLQRYTMSKPDVVIRYMPAPHRGNQYTNPVQVGPGPDQTGIIIGVVRDPEDLKQPPPLQSMTTSFSPWLLSSCQAVPPSYIVGTVNLHCNGREIARIEGPESSQTPHILGAVVSQVRPSMPSQPKRHSKPTATN